MKRFGWMILAALALVLSACDNGNGSLTLPPASITSVEPGVLRPGAEITVVGTGFYATGVSGQTRVEVCGVATDAVLVDSITQWVVLPPGGPVHVQVGTELKFTVPAKGFTGGEAQSLNLTRPDGGVASFAGITCEAEAGDPVEPEPVEVTAVIEASATSAVAPATISFNAAGSTGEGELTYEWQFGLDGATGEGIETEYEYDQPGSFTVVLTVRDETGSEATAEQEIVIHPELQAVIGLTDGLLRAPATVVFDALASTGVGPLTYNWTFGVEDAGSTQAEAEFTYQEPGEYEVELTVTDANGGVASVSRTVTVHPAAHAVIVHSDVDGRAPVTVSFDATGSSGIEPLAFAWSFGVAEAVSSEAKPEFTYTTPGVYEVVLTVTDAGGGEATATESLAIDPPVLAVIDFPADDFRAPATVQFDGSASTGVAPLSYSWTIGNGDPFGDDATSEFTFNEPGSFEITLTVEDAIGAVSTATETVTVNPPVNAVIHATQTTSYAPVLVEFDATDSTGVEPLNYSWELGTGQSGSGPTTTYEFVEPGTYLVELTVTDALGVSASSVVEIEVEAAPLYPVSFVATVASSDGYDPFTNVSLTVTSNGDGSTYPVTSLDDVLNLPAGTYSLAVNSLERTYTGEGAFTESMSTGGTDFTVANGAVSGVEVQFDFVPSDGTFIIELQGLPDSVDIGTAVQISSNSEGPSPVTGSSMSMKPGVYQFDFANVTVDSWTGEFVPNFVHSTLGLSSNETRSVTVVNGPVSYRYIPVAAFEAAGDFEVGKEVLFTADSRGGGPGEPTYSWSLDGDTVASGSEFRHTFEQIGSYEVELTVTNGAGTETDSTSLSFVVIDPSAPPGIVLDFTPRLFRSAAITIEPHHEPGTTYLRYVEDEPRFLDLEPGTYTFRAGPIMPSGDTYYGNWEADAITVTLAEGERREVIMQYRPTSGELTLDVNGLPVEWVAQEELAVLSSGGVPHDGAWNDLPAGDYVLNFLDYWDDDAGEYYGPEQVSVPVTIVAGEMTVINVDYVQQSAAPGNLVLSTDGLPEGTEVNGTLTHPGGATETIDLNSTLQLPPGTYSVSAPMNVEVTGTVHLIYTDEVAETSTAYTATQAQFQVSVVPGGEVEQAVQYAPQSTMPNVVELRVEYRNGENLEVDVVLYGPDNSLIKEFTSPGSHFLNNAAYGQYRVVVNSTTSGSAGIWERFTFNVLSNYESDVHVVPYSIKPPGGGLGR